MLIKSAKFIISNTDIEKCPEPDLPEYAFIGRSNVGKSSLINMLTERKSLAKISGKPGKTRLINHFLINKQWYLTDLPGYGYAKISKEERQQMELLISDYIVKRKNLLSLFVLLDSRHKPQLIDLEFMQWLGEKQIPFTMVFTKIDKLKKTQVERHLSDYADEMLRTWVELPQLFITSATKRTGRKEILDFIDSTNKIFTK